MKIELTVAAHHFVIDCTSYEGSSTLTALKAALPLRLQLHTPKIAGSHIYWHAPFLVDEDRNADIMKLPPGTFLYWPERQFLEVIFAPLQAESAAVTVLGMLDGPVEPLQALGEQLRVCHGRELIEGMLRCAVAPGAGATLVPSHSPLSELRRQAWATCPEEIDRLLADRGVMHPAGPLVFAESEARSLHELLYWIRRRAKGGEFGGASDFAGLAVRKAANRLSGYCHLTTIGTDLLRFAQALEEQPEAFAESLDEAIVYVGRIAAWLDLHIPWGDFNEVLRRVDDNRRRHA